MKSFAFILFSLILNVELKAVPLKGIVTDALNGEIILGATVVNNANFQKSVLTGLDGSFTISVSRFPATIIISAVGYKTQNITVTNDNAIKILLEPVINSLSTVNLIAVGEKSNDNKARSIEQLAPNVMNIVSARAIEISPDLTVANVIQRVSGVTVERNNTGDGQYANLRGMDKRYNYTLVNGIKIPSPDNKNRFVPLDIFPAEMLARLEVTKSLTADMEGDGIGGAINLVMKEAPAKKQITFNISTGYNLLFLERPFNSYNHSAIKPASPYEMYGNLYEAKTRDFPGDLLQMQSGTPSPNLFGGASYGNRFLKQKLGLLLAGNYQHSYRGSNGTNFSSSIATSDASNLPVLTGINRRTYSDEQTRIGLHGKIDYRFSENHYIQWYNAWLDFKTFGVRDENKTDFSIGYDPINGNYNKAYDTRFRISHQNIITSSLNGMHHFLNKKLTFDWSAVYSKALNETPDNSTVHTVSTVKNNTENQISVVTLGGAERRWEHNSDEDKSGYFNFHYYTKSGHSKIDFSTGGLYRDKQRENFFNEYSFRPFDDSKPAGSKNNLIKGIDWNNYDEIKFSVFNPYGSTGDPLNYEAAEIIMAGYLQAKITAPKLQTNLGLRIENTNQGYELKYPVTGVANTGSQIYTDLLPSIHFRYSPGKNKNIRTSYVKSINRPSFFEIVPYRIISEDFVEMGNPDIRHTIAHNLDIRYEYFPKPSEQIMVGAFYKKLVDPIEYGMITQGQGTFYMPSNFGNANNYGLEIDVTKYFHSFGFKFNYTYTKSAIKTDKLNYVKSKTPTGLDVIALINTNQTRQLNGQSAHIGNLSLLYKNVKRAIDAQLSFLYNGERLYAISRYLNDDIWQSGYIQMDASLEKKFGKYTFLFFKATNFLNTPFRLFIKKYNKNNENVEGYESFNNGTMIREDYYGQNIQIGFRFKF